MHPHLRHLLLGTTAVMALGLLPAIAGPNGPSVVGGAATVTGAGSANVVVNQTTSNQNGEARSFAIPAGVKKIPTAITSPTINIAAVRTPICLLRSVKSVSKTSLLPQTEMRVVHPIQTLRQQSSPADQNSTTSKTPDWPDRCCRAREHY